MRSGQRGMAVICLCLVIAVASGCNPGVTPLARSSEVFANPRCQVGIVGDSLLLGARDIGGLTAQFGQRGCEVAAVDVRKSRHTSEGLAVIDTWARHGVLPRVLIVGLGTNDCNGEVFDGQVRHVLRLAGPERPVVWINTWRPGCDRALNDALFAIQAELNARPDGGNLWILNHWQWIFENRGFLARDGIHLTSDGYRAHAARLASAVTG